MKQQEIQLLKKELLKMKEEFETRLSTQEDSKESAGDTGELSNTSNHPGDQGTELFDRQKEMTLDNHLNETLEEVSEALEAIQDGTYGKCAECGKEIQFERLEAIPTTKWCIDHAKKQTEENKRPVEEDITSPLKKGDTSYKQELRQDTWEAASEHGTSSDTPDGTQK
ncbi:hypothetical protein CR203_09020 [Salipaludibacillus neizhouensis]|uniref:Zinc finger DksA/TraR C4-type domain-containing protein n=1 Tax=Salipaludibacillus neizhouensis TaxID=885475 RepID=A0A3A9KAA7_9BACI|nr:TraR/DksA C4-type zinc finger protein [Salipaludibacillus neizhouensis]RKL67482.1 hypothetical protein CR203_09020 [Salipaludibacillus neizhouensis]